MEHLACEIFVTDRDRARLAVEGRHYCGRPALDAALERRLLEASLDPAEYGRLLFQALFPGDHDDLLIGYLESLTLARRAGQRLRFRLHVTTGAPAELHDLHWELLYDPRHKLALGRSPDTAFSRYLGGSFDPGSAVSGRPRVLVVLSCPADAGDYGLAAIDRQTLRHALERRLSRLDSRFSYELLEGPATIERIRDRLVAGELHALHLQAHGRLDADQDTASLVLENDDRSARFVGDELFSEVFESHRALRLVSLVACHAGSPGSSDPFSGLGPALVRRGIPAVVAMRREIGYAAAGRFTEHFYLNLLRSRYVDVAANEARLQLYLKDPESPDWGTPALYMHLRDGLLWEDRPQPAVTELPPAGVEAPPPGRRARRMLAGAAAVLALVIAWRVTLPKDRLPDLSRFSENGTPKLEIVGFEDLRETPSEWRMLALSELLASELEGIRRMPGTPGFEILRTDSTEPETDSFQLLVRGHYDSAGTGFRIEVHLRPLGSGESARLEATGKSPAELLDSIGRLASQLVRSLGLEPVPVVPGRTRSAHTGAPEATHLHAQARERLRVLDAPSARPLLEEALEVEPRSPQLRTALAEVLLALGHKEEASAEIERLRGTWRSLRREGRCSLRALELESRGEWKPAAAVLHLCYEAGIEKGEEGTDPDLRVDLGLRLASLQARARWSAGARETLDGLRPLAGEDPRYLLAEAEIYRSLSRYEEQREAARRATLDARRHDAPLIQARALVLEGEALQRLGDVPAAADVLETAGELYHTGGHQQGEADAHQLLGNLSFNLGNLAEAGRHYDEARELYAVVGNQLMETRALGNQALILKERGDDRAAISLYQDCLALHRRASDHGGEVYTRIHLAEIYEKTAEVTQAEEALVAALDIEQQTGGARNLAYPLRVLGEFRSRHGSLTETKKLLSRALDLYAAAGNKQGQAATEQQLARAFHQSGDPGKARELLDAVVAFHLESGDDDGVADARKDLGDVLTAMGEIDPAEVAYRLALETQDRRVDRMQAASTRRSLARLLLARGRPDDAAAVAAAALADLESTNAPLEEALARGALALTYLALDRSDGARREIDVARRLYGQAGGSAYLMPVELAAARIHVRGNELDTARRELQMVLAVATAGGFLEARLEAHLLQGEIALRTGNPAAADALREVEREADAHGFVLLSKKASEARLGGRPSHRRRAAE